MKKLFMSSLAVVLSTSVTLDTFAKSKEKILTPKQQVQHLKNQLSKENQEIIAELISDSSIRNLSSELGSSIIWTDEMSVALEKRLKSRSAALVASIFGNQLGISSPSSIIWEEAQKVNPQLTKLSAESTLAIEKKLLPKIDEAANNTIFEKSVISGNIGARQGNSVIDLGAEFCFKPIPITDKTGLKDNCLKAQLGSITGVQLINGKIASKNSFAKKLKKHGIDIHVSAINLQHNFNSGNFTFELVRPGLEYKPLKNLTLRVDAPIGVDSNGIYSNLGVKARVSQDFKIAGKRGCASLDLGTSFGVGGNVQLFGAAEAMVDLNNEGLSAGLMGHYLTNTQDGNTRGNQTLSGGQFYGPGYFVGVGLRLTK